MNRDLSLARWLTFSALMAIAGIFLLPAVQRGDAIVLPMLALSVVAGLLLTLALELWLRLVLQRNSAPGPGLVTYDLHKAFELNRKFIQAASAQEVLEATLAVVCDVAHAAGSSFVPYDEWGQKLPALVRGAVPSSAVQAWAERLSAPGTRQACKTCQTLGAGRSCVLLRETRGAVEAVRCLVLPRGERAIGVFNLYFESSQVELTEAQRTLLEQVMASASAALQRLAERDDQLSAQHIQPNVARATQNELLKGLLRNLHDTLEVDFASFWIPGGVSGAADRPLFLIGEPRGGRVSALALPEADFMQGLWESLTQARQPIHLANVSLHEKKVWPALSAYPVQWNAEPMVGLLLVGGPRDFTADQMALLRVVASDAALILLNARAIDAVEYQAVIDERTRLAREIHDGLAQTLAFLKMQSDQMQLYLAQGKLDRLSDLLAASNRTLGDAYLDARQAIDDLRRIPDLSLADMLRHAAENFSAATGLRVDVSQIAPATDIPLNARPQVIRIVQEALANVRKHAHAQTVSVSAYEQHAELILEVRDDGLGFAPDLVVLPARYGLRGMRERAELIGAEFQVISRPGEGTTVRLQIPTVVGEEK